MHVHVLFYVVFVLCGVAVVIVYSQTEGEGCQDGQTGSSGVCKTTRDCPSVTESLKPQICEFKGTVPIICCTGIQPHSRPTVGAKANQKCKEYAKYAYRYYPLELTNGPKNVSRLDCGFTITHLIVGEEKAKGREFPHCAAIGYDTPTGKAYICGGSLISENFVLTAAQCQNSRQYGLAKSVRLGDLNLVTNMDDADPQEYDIAEFVRHPDYCPPSRYNDILLIRLSQNVRFTKHVRPTCLYTGIGQQLSRSAIASGWGNILYSHETTNDDLLKVNLDFFRHEDCFNFFPKNQGILRDGIVNSTQICAGSKTEFKVTCQGNSGSPLQIYNLEEQCMYLQVGITSFGKVCGVSKVPAVYTRVSHYIDWIEQNVWPN